MSRRDVLRLLPLLGLLLALTYLLPERPDDEAGYLELARRLAGGWYATGDEGALLDADPSYPDLWFGPGLPAVLAPLVALDVPLELLRATGALFLFGAAVALFALLRPRTGERLALAAAVAFALYPPFWTLLPSLHSEPLAILCLCAGVLAAARHLAGGGRWSLVAAGTALAGLALTRVAFGWVLTVLLVAAAARWALRRTPASARTMRVFALALLLCVPWLAFTYHHTGRPLVWGNSGSLSLYWMSSPFPDDQGDWNQADRVFHDERLAPHRPFFETLRGRPLAEQNELLERQALRNIAHHPGRYAENVVANLTRMFFNVPYGEERPTAKVAVYAFPNALLLGAAMLAGALLVRRRRLLPVETPVVVGLAVATVGLHALVAAYPRMLMPAVPLVLWALATGLALEARAAQTSAVG